MGEKIRCVLAGTGSRGIQSYANPIVFGHLNDRVQLVGLYDEVVERAELASRELAGVPVYTDFKKMPSPFLCKPLSLSST